MSHSKDIEEEVQKLAKIIDLKVPKESVECIAENMEKFINQVIEQSLEICLHKKRKIISLEDVKEVIFNRKIEFIKPIFD